MLLYPGLGVRALLARIHLKPLTRCRGIGRQDAYAPKGQNNSAPNALLKRHSRGFSHNLALTGSRAFWTISATAGFLSHATPCPSSGHEMTVCADDAQRGIPILLIYRYLGGKRVASVVRL